MPTKKSLYLLILAGFGSVAAPAFAQEAGSGYVGVGGGQAKANLHADSRAANVLGAGLTPRAFSLDERENTYKLFLGYQFTPRWGIEAGAYNLGKFGIDTQVAPAGVLNERLSARGLSLDLVGNVPITEKFSLLGRVGAAGTRVSGDTFGSGAASARPGSGGRNTKVDVKAGVGLQYAFSPNLALRGEVERYRMRDAVGTRMPVTTSMLSLVWSFGAKPQAPRPVAMAEPTYVAPPPPPAPVVAPPPPPPAPMPAPAAPVVLRTVSFSAESLFGFDKAVLRPNAKTELDKFSNELSGTRYDRIEVKGHTDRIGTPAYNQKLSEERAAAVKGYLVENGHIDSSKIVASGLGETSPVTAPGDCKGNAPTKKLKECLQPDRRVDVVVTGQR